MKKTQIEMFALKCGVGKVLLVLECYEVLFGFSRCDQMAIKIHLESEKKQGYRSERIALGHFVLSVPTSVFERNAFHAMRKIFSGGQLYHYELYRLSFVGFCLLSM